MKTDSKGDILHYSIDRSSEVGKMKKIKSGERSLLGG